MPKVVTNDDVIKATGQFVNDVSHSLNVVLYIWSAFTDVIVNSLKHHFNFLIHLIFILLKKG